MNWGFLFFLALMGWAFMLMALLPRIKAGHALLSALCGMLFVSFYGVIAAQVMRPTAYLVIYGGLGALLASIALIIANQRNLRKRVLTVGMGVFVVCGTVGVVVLNGLVITDHDSLSYWMRIVRELFMRERFPIHMDSNMSHRDYIPLLASLQYCVVALFGWQDASLSYVTFACILTAISAIVDLLDEHKGWSVLAAVALLYAYQTMGSALYSIRADGPISALFAAGMLCLFFRCDDSTASWLPTLCIAAVLAGFKIYTGLMLALVLGLSMLLCVKGAVKKDKTRNKPLLLMSLLALGLCLAMQFTWSGLYHYMTELANYEAGVARVAYTGVAYEATRPVFSLTASLAGNPRNDRLVSSFNQESLNAVGKLISETCVAYGKSRLTRVWLFFVPIIPIFIFSSKAERKRALVLLATMLIAGVIYLLGLFGSYFVQAETSAAAVNYLVTVTTPLMMALVFITIDAAASHGKRAVAGRAAVALSLVGMLLMINPAKLIPQLLSSNQTPENYAALAQEYYDTMIMDQLTPEDADKHALFIDCSYGASEIKSESGKTHAFQYYGMPMYVHVLQYPYADYDLLENVTAESLENQLNRNRCDLLMLNIDDEIYWGAVQDALGLYGDADAPIAVYDVVREDGVLSFLSRADSDFE